MRRFTKIESKIETTMQLDDQTQKETEQDFNNVEARNKFERRNTIQVAGSDVKSLAAIFSKV